MENEADLLDTERSLSSTAFDVFQSNFRNVVQSYLPEKLEQSGVDELSDMDNKRQSHQ